MSSCKWIPDSMCSYQGVQIQCPFKCGLCEGSPRKGLEKMTDLELIMEEEFLQVQYKDDDLNDVDNSTTTSQPTSDRILHFFRKFYVLISFCCSLIFRLHPIRLVLENCLI